MQPRSEITIPFKGVSLTKSTLSSSYRRLGENYYGSVFIKDIKMMGYEYRSSPKHIVTGVLLLLVGIVVDQVLEKLNMATQYMGMSTWIGVFLLIIFLLLYYTSRVKDMVVYAGGGKMRIDARNVADKKVEAFILNIQELIGYANSGRSFPPSTRTQAPEE